MTSSKECEVCSGVIRLTMTVNRWTRDSVGGDFYTDKTLVTLREPNYCPECGRLLREDVG